MSELMSSILLLLATQICCFSQISALSARVELSDLLNDPRRAGGLTYASFHDITYNSLKMLRSLNVTASCSVSAPLTLLHLRKLQVVSFT